MKLRRTLSSVTAIGAVVATIVVGSAAPASASPYVIPTCAHMFDDPASYWSDFASVNGASGVAVTPTRYGSDNPDLKDDIVAWHGTSCTWGLSTNVSRTFSISETVLTSVNARVLRSWFSSHGITGTNEEATLGGVLYKNGKAEWDLLIHGKIWVAITPRSTSVYGYTMQSATYTLFDLNPTL